MSLPLDKRLYANGYVCSVLSVTPTALENAMQQAGASFALELNGVPYLDGNGLKSIVDFLRELNGANDGD